MQTIATASRADQNRALGLSTIAFTACFAVWTIFSIIGVAIKAELGLNDTQFGLLVATPILTGSITRLFLGVWTEKYGGRLVFSSQMILTALATWALTFTCFPPTKLTVLIKESWWCESRLRNACPIKVTILMVVISPRNLLPLDQIMRKSRPVPGSVIT